MKRHIVLAFSILLTAIYASAQAPDKAPVKLRVGTYNVGHFNQGWAGGLRFKGDPGYSQEQRKTSAAKEMVAWRQWIGAQSLDFLCVQEWNRFFDADSLFNAEEELLKPYYNNIYFGDERRWIFNGIATNYKLHNINIKYSYGDYYALTGDLKLGDKVIKVISTHIPWQKDWHKPALNQLMEVLKGYEYFICFGDFNATDAEQTEFRKAGFNMANGGYQGWFGTANGTLLLEGHQGKPDVNIDNIITSGNIKIMNVSAPRTGLNDYDHLPLLADLVITGL